MLTVKIYLEPSGRVANLIKDFPIYQRQYNNILLNVFVPTSILAPNFTVLSTELFAVDSPFVSGTAVEIASRTIERNGKYKLSKTYYMRYVKTLVKEGTEYALFERKLPKEFVFYAGAGINAPEMILNVVNVNFGEVSSATAVSSNAMLQVSVNLPNTVIPVTQDYMFKYGIENKWYLNGYEVNIEEEYGITYKGTAVQGDTITLSVVASKPTTIQTVTSQTVYYDVMPSTDIDQEPSLETSEIETIEAYLNALKSVLDGKQDKIDYGLTTSQKSVVGAINTLASFITNNNNSIALINQVLSVLQNDVNALRNVVATGEDYLGTYTYQAINENDLPTDNQLLSYAKSVRGSNYELKNGDVILVVQLLTDIPAKRYKYIYNESENKWDYFEIQPVEMAQNGTAGIVYGTWGTGDTNHTLIDITNGKISHIFIEETENNYVDLHEFVLQNKNTLNNIITGITSVGLSQRALKDGLGNVIDTTYLTKEVGATQQFVKDYALAKQFNDTYYLGKDTETNEFVFAPTLKPTAIQVSTTLGDNEIFTAKSTATYEFDLNGRNGQTMRLVCSLSLTENAQIRVTTSINNRVIGVSLTPLNLTNELQVFEVRSNYDLLGEGEEIKVNIGDQISQKVELVRTSSATAQFEVISLSSIPTTLGYLLDYQSVVSAKVLQTVGNSKEDVMSQKAVTELLNGKVDKVTTAYKVYGTDGIGNQKVYPTGWAPTADNIQLMDYTPNGGYTEDGSPNKKVTGTYVIGIPKKPSHATPKKWVEDLVNTGLDGKLDKTTFEEKTADIYVKTSSNTAKIENLTNILLDNEQVAIAEVSQAFTTRQTADGESIIDEQNVFPKLIKGSTVKTVNLLDDSYFINKPLGSGFTSKQIPFKIASGTYTAIIKTKNVAKIQPNVTTLKLYDNAGICIIDILETGLISNSNSFNNAVTFTVTEEQAKVIEKIGFFFNSTAGTDYIGDEIAYIMLNEGTSIKPYSPYFNGLKNAYFEKVVSTGRNLIDLITPFAAQSSLEKPFSFAEGTYTLQVICDDYDGQKSNVVDVEFLDENYNRVLPLNNGSQNGINSWSTFSITAEEAARTRYISVYMNGQTGADLIGKRIKLMLNYGTEVLPYEPYTEDTYQLPQTLELGEWDYILPQEQKIVRQTRRVEFTGTESFSLVHISDSDGSDSIFAYKTGVTSIKANKNEIISNKYVTVTDDTSRFFMDDGYIVQGHFGGELEYIYIRDDRFSTVDEWKAYLAEQYAEGDPVIVEYKIAEATEEDIVIPNNYTAYQGGLEKVVQGNTDNSEYGAMCTLTNDYFVKVGGATNEKTE